MAAPDREDTMTTTSSRRVRTVAGAVLGTVTLMCSAFALPVAAVASDAPHAARASDAAFCNAGDLRISYHATDAGAGHRYGRIVLRNTGGQACRTHGYGGVSYTDDAGRVVGAPADRTPGREPTVLLRPGQRVVSRLDEVVAQDFPRRSCRPVKVADLQVYPPEGEYAQLISHPTTGCANSAVHLLAHKPYTRP